MYNIFFELVDLLYSDDGIEDIFVLDNREPINFYDTLIKEFNAQNNEMAMSKIDKSEQNYFDKISSLKSKSVPNNDEKNSNDSFQNYLFKHMIEDEYEQQNNRNINFDNNYSNSYEKNIKNDDAKNYGKNFEQTSGSAENSLLNMFLNGDDKFDYSTKSSQNSLLGNENSKSLGSYKEFLKNYYESENRLEKADNSENFLNYFLYSSDDSYQKDIINSSGKKSDYNKDRKENRKTETALLDELFAVDGRKEVESDAVSNTKPYMFFWNLEEDFMKDKVDKKNNEEINSVHNKSGYNDAYFSDYIAEKYGNSSKVNAESFGGFRNEAEKNNPLLVDNLGNNEDVLLSKIYQVLASQGSGLSTNNASMGSDYTGDISVNVSGGNYEISSIMNDIGSKLRQAMQGSSNKSWYS